ncbi:MAG: NAD(P)H-hydrate dehydratase [Candidatus Paceibacteria bacterium]
MEYLTEEVLKTKPRKPSAHKGDYGKVLIIAGSKDYSGAAVMTATACEAVLRSGADLSVVCCPEQMGWLINNKLPEAITIKLGGDRLQNKHLNRVKEEISSADVLLIGPGLSKESQSFAKKTIHEAKSLPKVIDAGAIRAVDLRNINNSIFTPHEQELKKLLVNSDIQKDELQNFLSNNIVLKKEEIDKIISSDRIKHNKTGNPVMTKGGTGDVLAGLIAGFVAQGYGLFRSACMGAYLNGAVGDYLNQEFGRTFTATDIVKNLDKIYK